jgi:hypothetical protein
MTGAETALARAASVAKASPAINSAINNAASPTGNTMRLTKFPSFIAFLLCRRQLCLIENRCTLPNNSEAPLSSSYKVWRHGL